MAVEAIQGKIVGRIRGRWYAMVSQEKLIGSVEATDIRRVEVGHPADWELLGEGHAAGER